MILNLVVELGPVVEERVAHHSPHLVRCLLLTGQRLQPVTELLNSLTCNGGNESHLGTLDEPDWFFITSEAR